MPEKFVYIACKQFTDNSCALQFNVCTVILELANFSNFNWTFLMDYKQENISSQFECIGDCIPPIWIHENLPNNCSIKNLFSDNFHSQPDKIDFIVCLGGDGTILNVADRFQQTLPPVLIFNFGTLGFLSTFSFDDHRIVFDKLMQGKLKLLERKRLECRILQYDEKLKIHNSMQVTALNEVLIGRREWLHMIKLDVFIDGKLVTTVHSDGIIFATSSGSTAYSVMHAFLANLNLVISRWMFGASGSRMYFILSGLSARFVDETDDFAACNENYCQVKSG